ncbi:hypothetical protein LXL04_013309 [Taraxacum kok-saghyz]
MTGSESWVNEKNGNSFKSGTMILLRPLAGSLNRGIVMPAYIDEEGPEAIDMCRTIIEILIAKTHQHPKPKQHQGVPTNPTTHNRGKTIQKTQQWLNAAKAIPKPQQGKPENPTAHLRGLVGQELEIGQGSRRVVWEGQRPGVQRGVLDAHSDVLASKPASYMEFDVREKH